MGPGLPPFLVHLLSQSPNLTVYLTAVVLALAYWRRAPRAAALARAGALLMLAGSVGWAFLITRLGPTAPSIRHVVLVSQVTSAVAHALWLAAIFVGRRTAVAGFPVQPIDHR